MELDDSSMISAPPEKEPVMEYSLMLTTLSGETFQGWAAARELETPPQQLWPRATM